MRANEVTSGRERPQIGSRELGLLGVGPLPPAGTSGPLSAGRGGVLAPHLVLSVTEPWDLRALCIPSPPLAGDLGSSERQSGETPHIALGPPSAVPTV